MIDINADGTVGDQQVRVWLGQHQGKFTLRTVSSDYQASRCEKYKNFIRWLTPMTAVDATDRLAVIDETGDLSFRLWLGNYGQRGKIVNLCDNTGLYTQAESTRWTNSCIG